MPGSSDGNYCQVIPTTLDAEPVISSGVFAMLRRADTGVRSPVRR